MAAVSKHEGASFLILRDARTRVRSLPNVFDVRAPQDEAFETRARAFEVCRTSSTCALLRMRESIADFTAHDVKQPISFSRRVGVRGLRLLLRSPRIEGGRSAERRSGARRNTREAYHDAGRSPLGAPPWRFWAPGAALASPAFAPHRVQRAPRTPVVVPGGRGPEPPGANGYKPPPQDATPRSAFRSLPEDALNERGWEWF